MYSKKPVLDKGYVQILNSMGDDLTVVNSAKMSKAKQSGKLTPGGVKLIKNLAD